MTLEDLRAGSALLCLESVSEELAAVRCLHILKPLKYPQPDPGLPLHVIPGKRLKVRGNNYLTIPLKRTALLECAAPDEDPEKLLLIPSPSPVRNDQASGESESRQE